MAQSDLPPSATAENNIETLKAAFHLGFQLPGGDGGGFHVAKGCLHTATGRKLESSDFTTMHSSGPRVPPEAMRIMKLWFRPISSANDCAVSAYKLVKSASLGHNHPSPFSFLVARHIRQGSRFFILHSAFFILHFLQTGA